MSTCAKATLYIGIDPGQNTGLAYWHTVAEKLEVMPAWPFWKAWEAVQRIVRRAADQDMAVVAVLEDPTQNAPVWGRKGQRGRKHVKIAQSVGMNKRDAQLWASGLERLATKGLPVEVERVRPTQSKWKKSTFENVTGYTGRTSEHGRDAARLVFQRG